MGVIGIDPGFSGAIAYVDKYGNVDVIDMPIIKGKKNELDGGAIRSFLHRYNYDMAFIEKAQSMPGQGISSTGRYMEGYGRIRGICEGMKIPYTLVHPRTWKRIMMADMPKDKGQSIVRVKQLFPEIDLPRKKDHGKADAILIAEYGRRQLK